MAKHLKACIKVRPVLSMNPDEAHTRVIGLYRAIYRYIPYIVKWHDIPKKESDVHKKVRELFYKNSCVEDVRVVDILVMKGYMELKEIKYQWMQKGRVMAYWHPTREKKPTDFLGKFLEGIDSVE